MDLTPYFSGIVSAAVFVVGAYVAFRNATERRFAQMEAALARQDERIARATEDARAVREIGTQIAKLSQKVDDLREDVSRHNAVIERTYKLEHDTRTAFHKLDELREDLHDMRIGGTK